MTYSLEQISPEKRLPTLLNPVKMLSFVEYNFLKHFLPWNT